jgi:uncharacterized protein YjbI with pentapeptide repeats
MSRRSKKPKPKALSITRYEVIKELKAAQAVGESANFANATISGSLKRLNLRNADFSNATLKGVNFTGSDVTDTNFRNADLTEAVLKGVDFAGSDVTDTIFRDADLTEANLETVTGLIPEQLLGAELTRCKLPDCVKNFSQLENIREVSKNAGAIFLTSLLACVFVLITVVSTGDMQLLSNTGTAQLPILNVSVGTSTFFTIAPAVLLSLYVSVHLYLGRLWAMMATLPAVFPDGVPAVLKTYPWLLNDLVVFAFPRLRKRMRPQVIFYSLVAYLFVPVSVMTVWLRVLPKHDVNLSNFGAGFFAASAVAALGAYWTHRRTLLDGRKDGNSLMVIRTSLALVFTASGAILPFQVSRAVEYGVPLSAVGEQEQMLRELGIYSWTKPALIGKSYWESNLAGRLKRAKVGLKDNHWQLSDLQEGEKAALETLGTLKGQWQSNRWWIPTGVLQQNRGFGSIREDQTRFTINWVGPKTPEFEPTKEELEALSRGDRESFSKRIKGLVEKFRAEVIGSARTVPRVSFVRSGDKAVRPNLRFLDASRAFLVNSDFRGADLTGANFSGSDLTGTIWWDDLTKRGPTLTFAQFNRANLTGVDLTRANLLGADLSGSNLTGAILTSANLFVAPLSRVMLIGAELSYANLTVAVLSSATLVGSNLGRTTLNGTSLDYANLAAANMSSAVVRNANLYGATLTGADLQYAILTQADFSLAVLTGSNLVEANLARSSLRSAILIGANLSGANLTGANLSNANLTNANLSYANLTNANLTEAKLSGANLSNANLTNANLTEAKLSGANLSDANLSNAKLTKANLTEANLSYANLTGASLSKRIAEGENLFGANLSGAKLNYANLTNAYVKGVSLAPENLINAYWKTGSEPELPSGYFLSVAKLIYKKQGVELSDYGKKSIKLALVTNNIFVTIRNPYYLPLYVTAGE